MKTSREQFDAWFNRRKQAVQVAGVAGHRIAMLERRMYEAWQASRQCIEVGGGDCVKIKLHNGGEASIRDIEKIEIVEYKGA